MLPGTPYTNTITAKAIFPAQLHSITARTQSLIFKVCAISFLFIGKEKKRRVVVILKVVNPMEKMERKKYLKMPLAEYFIF